MRLILNTNYNIHSVVAYLDDFLVVAPTRDACLRHLNTLLALLRKLGFWINYNKVEGPTQHLIFLGIELNTVQMTLCLPHEKIADLRSHLQVMLSAKKTSKRQLQSLCGKLNYATRCIYGGRFHLRCLLDVICSLNKPWHRTRVTQSMKEDCCWWLSYMDHFNGTVQMVDPRPLTPVYIDACNEAAGAFYEGHWLHVPWKAHLPAARDLHINAKEVLALEPACQRWGPLWANRKVLVHSDNQAAVAQINRGSSRDPVVMAALRRIFWLSATYNFRLYCVYLPGIRNNVADAASRFYEPNGRSRLFHLLSSSLPIFNASS